MSTGNQTDRDWMDRRKALDPEVYKNQYYPITIQVGNQAGGTGSNSVTLKNTPFVLDSVSHSIVGATPDNQDGQYRLLWRDDMFTYMKAPIMANNAFGWPYSGPIYYPPVRQYFRGSRTLTIDVINLITRGSPGTFEIEVVFIGIERWDQVSR